MSVEKNSNLLRSIAVSLTVLAFAACGVETVPVADEPAQAPTQTPAPLIPAVDVQPQKGLNQPASIAPVDNVSRLRASKLSTLAQLQPQGDVVIAHSLDVPDGTEVTFMLGMVGCGIMVVASGTVSVTNGTFEIPYDPANAFGADSMSLYFRIGSDPCDETNPNVFEIGAPLPGSVDLSQAQVTYGGCWMFGGP